MNGLAKKQAEMRERWAKGGEARRRGALIAPEPVIARLVNKDGRCAACRAKNCLACDGGDCRCVCALELDQPRRRTK